MLTRISALTLVAGLILPPGTIQANEAHARAPIRAAFDLPVTGTVGGAGTFTGAFRLDHFAARGRQVVAVGVLGGVLTGADGNQRTGLKAPVELPVTVGAGPERAAAGSRQPGHGRPLRPPAARFAQQETCGLLHLALIGTTLDLLGLTVSLNLIVIDIDGNTEGPLGNLVCQILGLLDNVAGLVASLNEMLARLGGSAGGPTA